MSLDDDVLFGVQEEQDKQCTYNVTLRCVRATTVAVEKAELLHSECVCSLVSSRQCACAILSNVACPAVQYYPTLSHKRHDFWREKKLLNVNCSIELLGETFLILSTERDMIKMFIGLHVKYP